MIFLENRKTPSLQDVPSFRELLEEKDEVLIDCLGDSITWGLYSSPELYRQIENGEIETGPDDGGQSNLGYYVSGAFQSKPTYPKAMEAELNRLLLEKGSGTTVTTVNDGIGGDWIAKRTYRRMTCDPDMVILLMGGNNFYFDYPIDGMFEENINALRRRGIPVYLANYPLYPGESHEEDFRKANEHIRKIADRMQVPLLDLSSRMEALVYEGKGEIPEGKYRRSELFSPDRIHLSQKGYELLGTFAAEELWNEIS